MSGLRFDRDSRGRYAVYVHGRYIGSIAPDGKYTSAEPKTMKRAVYELESRGLLGYANRRTRRSRFGDLGVIAETREAGRRIQVFDTGRGYFVEVQGITAVPGPFRGVNAALARGRDLATDKRLGNRRRRRR